ncbi:MAG: hypothetical protein B6I28_02780 [Fusobacteriia bacterium 4572_132]|nr:MAG: hypothetical protein B6I28_02780 [Fusobacteriia bacterium 4572_132]
MKLSIKFFLLTFVLILLSLSGCKSTNKYMVRDSKEYDKVTRNFVGEWATTKYSVKSSDLLDTTYEKITANFDFNSKIAKFTYLVSEGKLAEKLLDWKAKYPDLVIDEYKIVTTSPWSINEKGEILYFSEPKTNIIIKGSGTNFQGFYDWEKTKFEAGKNIGKGGGLMGLVANKIAKTATGTSDLFPKLDSQFNFNFSKDRRNITIYSISKTNIKLSKIN